MQLKDVMTHPVVTCPADAMADAPARLMWEFDCGFVPLVDNEGRLAGVITDRDITMAALTQGKPVAEILARSAMAADVVMCHPEDSVETAERLMREAEVRRIPIVDRDRRPVGVFAVNDLARLAGRAHKAAVDRELAQTLAGICQPRAHLVRQTPEPNVVSITP